MTPDLLSSRISSRTARVAVIGLGYVGLPLAVAFARAGFPVVGIDVDEGKVAALNAGRSYIGDISDEDLRPHVVSGRLRATTDYDVLRETDAIFICVPTPYDAQRAPDLSYIRAAAEGIRPRLRPGQLVVLQSTTYPGTTEEVVQPILEASGLRAGVDFYLAFSPERIDPGNQQWSAYNTPKVVGGIDPESTRLACELLGQMGAPVHPVSSPRAAEMTKLLENIFRAVNIALVNELALLSERMGIDFWEVIEAAKTKPFGFMPFYPGAGVGGHCIPVDPYY
ncbi:MAG: nucleotide sugar dehydrogenase, partial [Anaerolineae bacterium]|nr:nucleotide sugar dehydrogenase [Anaerolineae bacterium]